MLNLATAPFSSPEPVAMSPAAPGFPTITCISETYFFGTTTAKNDPREPMTTTGTISSHFLLLRMLMNSSI